MKLHLSAKLALAAILLLGCSPAGTAQSDVERTDRSIVDFEKQNPAIMDNLEYLCDMIGPRLTGSKRLEKANRWTMAKMTEYGLENVHLEGWTIPEGWQRGPCQARILEPNGMPITCAAWAWTPNTHGTVVGPAVLFNPADEKDLARYKGKLKNAIILYGAPQHIEEHPSLRKVGSGLMGTLERPAWVSVLAQQLTATTRFLKDEGAAVVLIDSGKPQMLLNMTGGWVTKPPYFNPTRLFVTNEDYSIIYRLLKKNVPVTMSVSERGTFTKGPITVYNTVGEIRGTTKPDEVVICGGHLDSWDLGQGAVDNGTGAMVTLETARLLKSVGVKPQRTIRFILFSGEEQGLYGSQAYVRAHEAEMNKISAVYINDTGTGVVTGIGLHGNPQDQAPIEQNIPMLKDFGVTQFSSFLMSGTDHASFAQKGVPGFWFMQNPRDYGWMHHSQSDTFDKALPDDLFQCATVMAISAYNTAQMPEMLPRK